MSKKSTGKRPIFILLMLLLIIAMAIPAQAAKRTATTVTSKTSYKNFKEYMTVQGRDSKKKTVWKYVTKKYPATELRYTKCVVRKDVVYIFEKSKVTALRKKDGKRLWSRSKISVAGHILGFDKSNNLYVTGYYDKYIYKVSSKGKILWKANTDKTGNYWPYKVTVSGNNVTVWYEMNSRNVYSKKKHKVILNVKNGRILKYS